MKNVLYFIFLLIVISCENKPSVELEILNKEINITDSLRLRLTNRTKNNYLIYLNDFKPSYYDSQSNLFVNILDNNHLVKAVYSVSDPIWLLDENGKMIYEDSLSQKKYFDCIKKDRSILLKLPAKESIDFKIPLIDSIDECGRKNYPILEKGRSYKGFLRINIDSSLIKESKLGDIEKFRKKMKFKLFQGELKSNTVNLEY